MGTPKTCFVVHSLVHLQPLHGVHRFLTRPTFLGLYGRPHALAAAHLSIDISKKNNNKQTQHQSNQQTNSVTKDKEVKVNEVVGGKAIDL